MINNSLLLRPIIALAQIIGSWYGESFTKRILGFIYAFFIKLNYAYENSAAARIAKLFTDFLCNSSILSFFRRKGNLARWWESSMVYIVTKAVVSAPTKLFKGIYTRFENVFHESIIFRLFKHIMTRLDIIAGLLLIVILVVDHKKWDNRYNLIIAVFLMFLIFLNTIIQRNWEFNFKALDVGLILFVAAVALSFLTSVERSMSFRFVMFYITSFLFVLIVVSVVKSEKSLMSLIELLLIGVTLIGLYGAWQGFTNAIPFDPSLTDPELNQGMPGRVYSTLDNPNNFAEVLLMTLPFYAAVVMNSKSFLKKSIYLVLALPPLAALFYTGARSAWGAFVVSVMVFVFLTNKRLIPLVIVAGVMCIPFIPPHVLSRIQTVFRAFNDKSAMYRVKIFNTALPMFQDYIFTGVGLGTDVFGKMVSNYKLLTKVVPPHTHILYMQIWIEMGLIGILSFMWFVYRCIKNSILNVFGNCSKTLKTILAAGTAALLGILAMSCFEYAWFYPRVMLIFWVLIGIILAALNIAETKGRKLSEKSV